MANRYWVGGTASWDATAGSKWSASSGGAGGEAVPTSSDDVFFDAASGGIVATIATADAVCATITFTGFTGQLVVGSGRALEIHNGGININSIGFSFVNSGTLKFKATSGSHTITGTAGGNSLAVVTIDGSGGTFTFANDSKVTTLTILNGTAATGAEQNIGTIVSSGAGTRVLNLGSSVLTFINGASFTTPINFSGSNFTLNAGTSRLNMNNTDAASRTFTGGGYTFYDVVFNTSHTISGSNGFNSVTLAGGTTTTFTSGTTQTLSGTFTGVGSVGNLVTIRATSDGNAATLRAVAKSLAYVDAKDSTALGGFVWYAPNGTNSGNLSGWSFSHPGDMFHVFEI